MRTVTYDRSAAVNLARNVLKFKADKTITAKGVRILCEAVIGMDAALAAAPDHPATAGDAEDAARLEWVLRHTPGDALRYSVGVLADTADLSEFRAAIDAKRASKGGE